MNYKNKIRSTEARYTHWSERHPYTATTIETTALLGVKWSIKTLGKKALGINLWNANPKVREAADIPNNELIKNATIGATREELRWRGISHSISLVLGKKGYEKTARGVKYAADVIFALGHSGLIVKDENGNLKANTHFTKKDHALPITPYIAARQHRRLVETRGLRHAIYAHSLNNGVTILEKIWKTKFSKKTSSLDKLP